MRIARIQDEDNGSFRLEYDNKLGKKASMRLDALTYQTAIREARSFLEINAHDRDPDGTEWNIE